MGVASLGQPKRNQIRFARLVNQHEVPLPVGHDARSCACLDTVLGGERAPAKLREGGERGDLEREGHLEECVWKMS